MNSQKEQTLKLGLKVSVITLVILFSITILFGVYGMLTVSDAPQPAVESIQHFIDGVWPTIFAAASIVDIGLIILCFLLLLINRKKS